jgi:hypothetical protein
MTIDELRSKVSLLSKRIRDLKEMIEDTTEDLEHNVAGSDAMGLGYVQAEQTDAKAIDVSAQVARMNDLILKAEHDLEKVREHLEEFGKTKALSYVPGKDPAKYID